MAASNGRTVSAFYAVKTRWFLLECCEKPDDWRPEYRERKWLLLGEALEATKYDQVKALLREAAKRLKDASLS